MKSIPGFPKFIKVDFTLLKEVEKALEAFPPAVSSITSGNIFCYRDETALKATRVFGNIVLLGFYKGLHFFTQPIGENKTEETAFTCLKYLKETTGSGRLNYIPKKMAERLKADKRFVAFPDRNGFDYVYDVSELAGLPGEKFHDKKNLVNQFKKKYSHEYKPLNKHLISQCLDIEEEWCRLRNCMEDVSTAAENTCIYELLTHFDELRLFGGVLVVDGKIQAFTILQRMNADTAVTHIEKANTEFKGIYQAINNYAANNELKPFSFVNREEDLGHAGLRKAKLSYNPVRLEEKYHVELA